MNVVPNKLCSSFMKAKFHRLGTHIGTFWLRICKGFLHQPKKNDAHVHELHIWHLHKIKTWVQVEISSIEFDTLFLEVKLEK